MIQSTKWKIEQRRLSRGMWNKQKYKYLKVIKFSVISKMLGYPGQAIRVNSGGHERLFERLNDAVARAIKKS